MYLSFTDYQQMGGTLDETAFNDFEFEAECIINWYTFNRLKNDEYESLSTDVKRCAYKLIQLAYQKAQASSLGIMASGESTSGVQTAIASQSNDGVSISYNTMSASDAFKNLEAEIEKFIRLYLCGVTNSLGRLVLYRGLYPGE